MPLHIVRDDIANMRVDAVVVPANSSLLIDGGAAAAVARAAGFERMQVACDDIGACPVGGAVTTPAFAFPAKVVVHAVGPVWAGGQSGEADVLYSCVGAALAAATGAGAESVALPLLSAGAFGYPLGDAVDVEVRAIRHFLESNDAEVWLVLYDREAVRAGRALFDDIEEYIDDVYVGEHDGARRDGRLPLAAGAAPRVRKEEGAAEGSAARKTRPQRETQTSVPDSSSVFAPAPVGFSIAKASAPEPGPSTAAAFDAAFDASPCGLEERLARLDESFSQTVLRLIDERGMTDVEVYKRANMSRQLFAKIRKDDGYRPTKKTACALAFALELNRDDAAALLERAGFALSHSSKFDVIIEYFLVNDIHDIYQVNEALFAYDQPLLG